LNDDDDDDVNDDDESLTWNSCLIFGTSRIRISVQRLPLFTGIFRCFPQLIQIHSGAVCLKKHWPLHSTSFGIYHL